MKPKATLRHYLLLAAASSLLSVSYSHAADVTWDTAPGTVGAGDSLVTGGAGTWDTTNGNWTTDGGANNIAWVNANNDTAIFGGTAGTVTLGTGITVGGLTFDTAGYTVAGNTLTFGIAGNIAANADATISSILAGNAITKTGTGTLVLTGTNSYTNTTISAGTLQIGAGGSTGTLGSGTVTNNAALIINRNDGFSVSNVISGSGSVRTNAGSLANLIDIAANNSYSGGTFIDGGGIAAQVQGARASYDATVATYRQTILTAFQQVEDALAQQRILVLQERVQRAAVAAAREAERLSLNQYRVGTVPYTTVVQTQTAALSAEQALLTIRLNRLVASANLVKALGGGWRQEDLPPPVPIGGLKQANPAPPAFPPPPGAQTISAPRQ